MRQILSLNAAWTFSKEATAVPAALDNTWEIVNLPHTWNALDGQDGNNDYHRGTCYYAKELVKADLPQAEQYFLELCGANSSADVYVNGKLAVHHDGGYSTFRANITELLVEENTSAILQHYPSLNDARRAKDIYENRFSSSKELVHVLYNLLGYDY